MKLSGIRKFVTTIRFRMLALYFTIVLLAFTFTYALSVQVMERALLKENTDSKQSELNQIVYSLTYLLETENSDAIYDTIKKYAQSVNGRVLVLDTSYIVQADSAALYNGYYLPYDEAVRVMKEKSSGLYGLHSIKNPNTDKYEWVAYYAQPLSANGTNQGILIMTTSVQQAKNAVTDLQTKFIVLFAAVLAVITIVWVYTTRIITKPVIELTDVMRHANAKTFDSRVKIKATGEVAELVDAFNRMGSELSAHDKIRDQFVADASHELKTPLAAIKALSESVIYCENPPVELLMDFLKDINGQVDRLNNIVQDLLQVARDSSKSVEYNMEMLDFSSITSNLAKMIKPVATKKGLKLITSIENNITVYGDKLRLERVVTNLIDNAIKYTENGSINVKLKRDRRDAVLTIKDTGIGIPEESIPRLFIRFYRVDKARSRATGGTGLGLSMVEEIVNRHGGNISVTSKLGEGSEFIVRIPLGTNE